MSFSFNHNNYSSLFKVDKNKLNSLGVYLLKLIMVDTYNNNQYYNIQLNITNSNSQIVSASIESID
jgi:hypothetical protein